MKIDFRSKQQYLKLKKAAKALDWKKAKWDKLLKSKKALKMAIKGKDIKKIKKEAGIKATAIKKWQTQ